MVQRCVHVRVASEVVICLLTSVFSAQMIVPGSHRYGHRPPPEVQDEHPPGAEHLEVPAGTTVIVRLQHLFCFFAACASSGSDRAVGGSSIRRPGTGATGTARDQTATRS